MFWIGHRLRAHRDDRRIHGIGRPLIWLSFSNEKLNAAFRYALVRLRDAAEAVGFYRGERVERAQLWRRFTPIIDNYRGSSTGASRSTAGTGRCRQAIVPLPWVIQAPRLFAGQIDFGDVGQTATVVRQYSRFAVVLPQQLRRVRGASARRSSGCTDWSKPTSRGRALPAVLTRPSDDGSVELAGVEVRTPAGDQLIDPLDVRLDSGDSLVITGRSGAGKTTLLRSLAELWPYASGTLRRPGRRQRDDVLVAVAVRAAGQLRTVVCYPNSASEIADDTLRDTLTKVALAPLCDRLDEERDWAKVLSPGEQQRVAFARILLTKPKAVFLDESTSALDAGLELALYQLLRSELPDCIVVSVSHRPAVETLHEQQLKLLGGGHGSWAPSRKEPAQV